MAGAPIVTTQTNVPAPCARAGEVPHTFPHGRGGCSIIDPVTDAQAWD